MDTAEFIAKVAQMRQEQKSYFKYRTPDHLRASKKLEAEIDAEIERLTGSNTKKPQTQQQTLF